MSLPQPKAPLFSVWSKGRPVTESFFETAPFKVVFDVRVAATPEEIWADHVSDTPLAYCTGLKVRWTSRRPFGVGAKRTATVLGAMQVREHFFLWDEAKRLYAFYVEEFNSPLIRALAERYQAVPSGSGSAFLWTVALEPAQFAKPPLLLIEKLGLFSLVERYWQKKIVERFGAPKD
jgi:hypothetical protein